MICLNCQNEDAHYIRISYGPDGRRESCERCGGVVVNSGPDVFCPVGGYFDENLADTKHPEGQYVESKTHKAQILRDLGLREAGNDVNRRLGRPMPYISDPEKRARFMRDNFGE